MYFRRDAHVYVGVDVHKRTNVAVMVDSWGGPVGKPMSFENTPAAFGEWLGQVQKRAGGMGIVFGLEDVHGLGRALAGYLLAAGCVVKFTNAYLTKGERDNVNKTDRNDALAVARITAKHSTTLPDADVDELQWALSQAVQHRRGLVDEQTRIKNRLHALLNQSYSGGYQGFFNEPFGKTALAFWERYPSPSRLAGVTVQELGDFLREQSHFSVGYKQAERILSGITPPAERPAYQHERDFLICSSVKALRSSEELVRECDKQLARLVEQTDYHLTGIPGIDVVMGGELIALVGDVNRFRTVDQFLAYTGIAPVVMGSGGKETRLRSQFGRRELMALFHRIASTQLVTHRNTGVPRNPEAKAYFERRLGDQAGLPKEKQDRKVRKKALLSLMRQQAIRFYKLMKAQKLEVMAERAGAGAKPAEGIGAA